MFDWLVSHGWDESAVLIKLGCYFFFLSKGQAGVKSGEKNKIAAHQKKKKKKKKKKTKKRKMGGGQRRVFFFFFFFFLLLTLVEYVLC
jgi:hypothetical protein